VTAAAEAAPPDEPTLTPEQANALLRELIHARVLACIDLQAVFDLSQALTISLEDAARLREDHAVALADALLAPAFRRVPDLLRCYVRVERAMRAEAEHTMDEDAAPVAPSHAAGACGRTTAAQDDAPAIDPPPPSIDTPRRCPGPPIQSPLTRPLLTRPPPPHRPPRAKKR
jgi:hypothetical protein